jgi:Domain of unknown function (DUF4383)
MATNAADITGREDGWSPARIFMTASAGYHLLLATVGLAIDRSFPVGSGATEHAGSEHIFGIFETNGWHSLAGLLLGVISVYYAVRPAGARRAALAIGVFHVVLVFSLMIWEASTFWLMSNNADQVVHSFTAIGGIGSALLTRPTDSKQTLSSRTA